LAKDKDGNKIVSTIDYLPEDEEVTIFSPKIGLGSSTKHSMTVLWRDQERILPHSARLVNDSSSKHMFQQTYGLEIPTFYDTMYTSWELDC